MISPIPLFVLLGIRLANSVSRNVDCVLESARRNILACWARCLADLYVGRPRSAYGGLSLTPVPLLPGLTRPAADQPPTPSPIQTEPPTRTSYRTLTGPPTRPRVIDSPCVAECIRYPESDPGDQLPPTTPTNLTPPVRYRGILSCPRAYPGLPVEPRGAGDVGR